MICCGCVTVMGVSVVIGAGADGAENAIAMAGAGAGAGTEIPMEEGLLVALAEVISMGSAAVSPTWIGATA